MKKEKMLKKKKTLIFYITIVWFFATAIFVYLTWPLLKSNFDYYFGKKSTETTKDIKDTANVQSKEKKSTEKKIIISKINVEAPIVEPLSIKEDDVLKALEGGVVHYSNTALPGEIGNVFITGHSSNYRWAKGDYNYIFANLNKLKNDDLIIINYEGEIYTYKVFEIKVVLPSDVSVLNQGTESIISIMTCDPPGTALKRRVVKAIQIEPDSKNNKPRGSGASENINNLIGN